MTQPASSADPFRRDAVFLLCACLGFALLRLAVARSHAVVGIDEALMHAYGDSWLRTGTYSGIQWPIVYPLLVAGLGRLIGARAAVDAIFVAGGCLMLVPLFLAVRQLRGSRVARWTVACVMLLPAVTAVTAKSGSHALYLPLLAAGFLLHVRALEAPRAATLALLGGLLGFAYVTRTDGIVTFATVTASLLLAPRGVGPARRLRSAVIVAAFGSVLVLANMLHVRQHAGRWQISAAVSGILQHELVLKDVHDPVLRARIDEFRRGDAGALERIARDPGTFVRRVAMNARIALRLLGDMHGLTIPLLLLAGMGVLRLLSGGGRTAFLVATWAIPPLAFVGLHVEARYFSPSCLFLMILSGEGCVALVDALRERGLSRWILPSATAVAASLLLMSASIVVAMRQIEERATIAKAERARELAAGRLPRTFILNSHVRFRVDGARGAVESAPMTRRDDSDFLLFDPSDEERDERPILEALRARGSGLRVVAEDPGGLILYERHPRDPQ